MRITNIFAASVVLAFALLSSSCATHSNVTPRAAPSLASVNQPDECGIFLSPMYPHSAIKASQEGWVHISYAITAGEQIIDVSVVDASPEGVFESAVQSEISRVNARKTNGSSATIATGCQHVAQFRFAD